MPAWTAITAADIEARIPAVVLATIRERYVDEQADPLAAIIADVTALVRGRIASNRAYSMDADATLLPPELKDDACWLCIEALKLRLGDATPITEAEKNRLADARKQLEAVAKGDLTVSVPTNPLPAPTEQSGAKVSVVSGNQRRIGRDLMRGLM